jgi:hypothetical protein
MRSRSAALALGLALVFPPAFAEAGEVRGVVRYRESRPAAASLETTKDRAACGEAVADETLVVAEGGGLANVVVRIAASGAPAVAREVTLDQRRCRFVPHVLAVPQGSSLVLLNGDPILHGVHGTAGLATAFNVPMPARDARKTKPLARPGPVRVGCDVHDWMSAWVFVVDGPFFGVSDASGAFEVAAVPPGEHAVVAWHERLGERVARIVVPATGPTTLEISYP